MRLSSRSPASPAAVAAVAALAVLGALAAAGLPRAPGTPRPRAAAASSAIVSISPRVMSARAASPVAVSAAAAPAPLTPQQIHAAYALPRRGAPAQTIAVLGAYDAPSVPADLSAYLRQFRLSACTEAGGCLRVVNEQGDAQPVPSADPTGGQFATESALGVQVARGVCQSCRILLVQASTPNSADLARSASTAAGLGATVAVTSITPAEQPSDGSLAADFAQPRPSVVAAAGDAPAGGFGYSGQVSFPASLPDVLAVGGTSLTLGSHSSYAGERSWNGTVSGCSFVNPAPGWQIADAARVGCAARRAVADVSVMADPGVIVHLTASRLPGGPWFQVTGTSVSAPIVAGVIGLAGSAGSAEAALLYRHARTEAASLHDVRAGASAATCTNPICRAGPGYDGPTGLGTPFGLGAFLGNGGALAPRRLGLTARLAAAGLVSHSGTARLELVNHNAFAVRGTETLVAPLPGGPRGRTVALARRSSFQVGPLGTVTVSITLSFAARARLSSGSRVSALAQLRARGLAGPTVAAQLRAGTLRRG